MLLRSNRLATLIIFVSLIATTSCHKAADIPDPNSEPYRNLVSAFYVGLAGLQAGEDVRAKQGLTLASQIAPGEPASWANLGVLALRQQQYDASFQDLEHARELAPSNSRIEAMLGLVESKRGNLPAAIGHLQQAVKLDGANIRALYELAQETERQEAAGGTANARSLLEKILQLQPNNQAVLLDVARLSAKLGDQAGLQNTLGALQKLEGEWPAPARGQLTAIEASSQSNVRGAAVQMQFLRNLLVRDVGYRRDAEAVRGPAGIIGEPLAQFLRSETPSSQPAPSDTAVEFVAKHDTESFQGKKVTWAGALVLDAKADPRSAWADETNLHLDQGTVLALPPHSGSSLNRNSVATGDLNYDFKTDIIIATAGGLRIYRQALAPLFTEVTREAKIDPHVSDGSYTGVWLFDVDLDGDLDIVLGTSLGEPVVLRNNGDGTFARIHTFPGINGVKDFVSADLDGDGDPDVAFIDGAGALRVLMNERLGNYRSGQETAMLHANALTAGDIDGDGTMDLVVLADDGRVVRVSEKNSRKGWDIAELTKTTAREPVSGVLLADIDNNGSLDLVVGGQVFLHDAAGFQALPKALPGDCQAVFDFDGDGRLDAVTLDVSGKLTTLQNKGKQKYKWQTLRTRAAQTTGDQRINSYGLGGEVEIRSGLLTQKQRIVSPATHFGLGQNPEVSLARIVWPNGQLQVEFDLRPDSTVAAVQRLKGSCPFLFAWDGTRMRFVKDCAPWSPALGLHVNAQIVAGIGQTQEWFKVPSDAVQPRDGFYDLRITAEYWETFYIDHYSFLAVDHPAGTELFTDERFAVPSPPLKLYGTGEPRPFAKAVDENGRDVTRTVNDIDGQYLDTFGRGRYQGVTKEHWVELTVPESAPRNGPLYLIGSGWLHPTDATINVALGQSGDAPPQGLSIDVAARDGSWKTVRNNLGFPAGRLKNVVLDLGGLFAKDEPRRFRLRTNLEIYWDRLAWASGVDLAQFHMQHLPLAEATLHYRGFSRISQANPSSPELPDYAAVEERGPRWRDLEGYYTRYGDVRPLLEKIDDRILITNAGDELRLKVRAPEAAPQGWTRDLILVGDGWIKDGDFNSVFSKTVLPLPYHGLKEYSVNSRSLEEDPAYRLHPGDWKTFHTRYVSPEVFTRALWQ